MLPNATVIIQMIVFAAFIWFTMKFVWPPIMQAMKEREKRIADGLAASERATQELAQSKKRAGDELKEAREQAAELLAQANKRSSEIVEEAKTKARDEGARELAAARAQIEQESLSAREQLRKQVASLAAAGAGQILKREIDEAANADIVDELAQQL